MGIRYAVAGNPISHSLSPFLFALVTQHLRDQGMDMDARQGILLQSDDLSSPMSWANRSYGGIGREGGFRDEVDSELIGNRLSDYASRESVWGLVRKVTEEVSVPLSKYVPTRETYVSAHLSRPINPPPQRNKGSEEAWLSLTTPLKHLFRPGAVVNPIDDSVKLGAVNQIRRAEGEWWLASTDGDGLRLVALHLGLKPKGLRTQQTGLHLTPATLCLRGGGGAARSTAAAWKGGVDSILWRGGRRVLDEDGPWSERLFTSSDERKVLKPTFEIDFDQGTSVHDVKEGNTIVNIDKATRFVASSTYTIREEATEQVIWQEGECLRLDGRWMLAAQHLVAWDQLFFPSARKSLPGLGLLMTRLIHFEGEMARLSRKL